MSVMLCYVMLNVNIYSHGMRAGVFSCNSLGVHLWMQK